MLKKGTPASPATARASSVLPVPGGPTSSTPLGIFAPSSSELLGVLEELDDLLSSSLASSRPATSSKRTLLLSSVCSLARLLPKDMARLLPPCIWFMMKIQRPTKMTRVRMLGRMEIHQGAGGSGAADTRTPLAIRSSARLVRLGGM